MRRYVLVGAGLLLGAVGVALLLPWSRGLVLGVLRHEPFYHSTPSSYWRDLLAEPVDGSRSDTWFARMDDAAKELRAGGARAMPVLAVLIHDPDPRVADRALGVVAWIGSDDHWTGADARSAIPALKELVQESSDGTVSLFAGRLLSRLEPEVRNDVLVWQLNALRKRPADDGFRRLFQDIRPNDGNLIPILAEMLDDARQQKWHADIIHALIRLGGAGKAVPAIARLLRDEDKSIKSAAITALGKSGDSAAASILADALVSEEQVVYRRSIAAALANIGSAAKAATPTLTNALDDADAWVRFLALVALVNADCAPEDAVDVLAEKLTDADGHFLYYAAGALGRLGPRARTAVPALLRASKDASSDFYRQCLAEALKKIDPDAAAKAGMQ